MRREKWGEKKWGTKLVNEKRGARKVGHKVESEKWGEKSGAKRKVGLET